MNQNEILFFRKTGEGKPVVILHGLFGMSDNWLSFSKQLAENGYSVYAVDLRNHGRSFHEDIFNYEAMVDDLQKLFSHEKLEDVFLIGHSLGGKVAMQFALDNPDDISKLMVIDMAPRYLPVHHDGVIAALNSVDLSIVKSRKEVETILDTKGLDDATKQFLLKNLYWKGDTHLDWRFNLPAIEKNIGEVGKEIISDSPFAKPTLFIRGEKSDYITDADFPQIKKLFPMAEIKTAPGAGHWVHADTPAWLMKEMIYFFTEGK